MTLKNYASYVDAVAKNGIVVFKIDLRGHGKSEGDPGGGYYSADYVIDTLNAFSALKQSDYVNPNNITLWGHSMSGNILLRSLVINPDINKIVIWAGAVYTYDDMQQFQITDNSYRPLPSSAPSQKKRQLLIDTYGQFNSQNNFWKQIVPTNYLEGVDGAIQIHHAIDDKTVSVDYSRNLSKILDPTTINHELFEYKTGGHNIFGTSFDTAIRRTIEFIKL